MTRVRAALRRRVADWFTLPVFRRIGFYLRRAGGVLDRGFFLRLTAGLLAFVLVSALLVAVIEKPKSTPSEFAGSLAGSVYWAVTTVLGAGDSSYVSSGAGYVVSWVLVLFGVGIVATITGALVGFVIDFLIKEGQGMGASGFRGHVVVCGWGPTARELIQELKGDDYDVQIVLLHDVDKNPGGDGVYYVNGDATNAHDLRRAGIEEAVAAVVFPKDGSNDADMHSILVVMAIEAVAPDVRTVVEVNNPNHTEHFQRAGADEILVTPQVASRLLARTALYPGLTGIVSDIVSGGDGSELYRVQLPDLYVGLPVEEMAARLRADHRATLLAVSRNGRSHVNPPADFRVEPGDDVVVVAESLGQLAPLAPRAV